MFQTRWRPSRALSVTGAQWQKNEGTIRSRQGVEIFVADVSGHVSDLFQTPWRRNRAKGEETKTKRGRRRRADNPETSRKRGRASERDDGHHLQKILPMALFQTWVSVACFRPVFQTCFRCVFQTRVSDLVSDVWNTVFFASK